MDADQFAADHGPLPGGALTASREPALYLRPDERPSYMPSALALALHLLGRDPLPDADNWVAERGRDLEAVAIRKLKAAGVEVADEQPRCTHPRWPKLRVLAYPDAVGDFKGGRVTVEVKTVDRHDYDVDWNGRAPLHARLQAMRQMICAGTEAALVVPLVITPSYKTRIDLGEIVVEEADPEWHQTMDDACWRFLAELTSGDLPPPDLSDSSYRALVRNTDLADRTLELKSEEATNRLRRWREARDQRLALQKIEKEHQHWFAAVAEDATRIAVPGEAKPLKRSYVKETVVPEHVRQGYWRWTP